MSAVPLQLVQIDPTGPSGGTGLDIGPDRLCVLRRGVFGSRRGPCVPRAFLRDFRQGTPDDLRSASWLSAAAMVALDRLAASDPHGTYLAIAFEGPATVDTWLFSGVPGAVDRAALLLSSPAMIAGDPGGPHSAPVDLGSSRRSGPTIVGILVLLVLAGIAGLSVYLVRRQAADVVSQVRSVISPPSPPPTPPTTTRGRASTRAIDAFTAQPYSVQEVIRALTTQDVVEAGWLVSAAPRVADVSVVIPLTFRGRPGSVSVYPSYRAALGRARGLAVQTGNVVVRYPRAAEADGLGQLVSAIQDAG